MSLTLKSFGSPWKQAIKDVERETGQEAVLYRESYQQFKNTFEGCVRGQTPNIDAKQAWKRMYNESMPKVAAPTANFNNLEASEVAAGMTIVNMGLEMVKGHAFMTKFAEQLADRYEAIDKPMLMRSLSRLFQVQKSVLTATDLESKAKALAKDEGFAILFAMDKEEFLKTVQLVESKIDRIQAEVEMLQGGGSSTSAFEELINEVKLQGGATDCEDLLKKECDKRFNEGEGDCRWVGKGQSYTNKHGEKVIMKKGKCKSKWVNQIEVKQKFIQSGVMIALLLSICTYCFVFGYSLTNYWSAMDQQLASLNKTYSEFWGYVSGLSFVVATVAWLNPATGLFVGILKAFTVSASFLTGNLIGKELTRTFAEQAMMFEAPIFKIEFLASIVLGIWALSELISIYAFQLPLRPKSKYSTVIGPAVGAITQYGIKYQQKVKDPVFSMFMGLLTMTLVMFFPWAISAVKAGFGAMKGCFSKGQKSAMTREVNNRRQLGTKKALRLEDNNNVPKKKTLPRLQCLCLYKTGPNARTRCTAARKPNSKFCGRHQQCWFEVGDDESKTDD
tara:strand:- start:7905 stop:9587 length:1683 start_codon:yes stop_codon:yes gene_type:complete